MKTSLAPGSKVVTEYLTKSGLLPYLEKLGFHLVGYGCTTLHRQQRAAARRCGSGREIARAGGGRCAQREPQLRGARAGAGARQLPGVSATGGGLRTGRQHDRRSCARADRAGFAMETSTCVTSGPSEREIQAVVSDVVRAEMFRRVYADVFEGDRRWQQVAAPYRHALRVGRRLHLHPAPAVCGRRGSRAGARHRRRGRPRARGAGRQRDHRSHLAGRIDPARWPGRQVPDRTGRRAELVQLLRREAREPRSDDARDLRQHPAEEPARPRRRGRDGRFTCRTRRR